MRGLRTGTRPRRPARRCLSAQEPRSWRWTKARWSRRPPSDLRRPLRAPCRQAERGPPYRLCARRPPPSCRRTRRRAQRILRPRHQRRTRRQGRGKARHRCRPRQPWPGLSAQGAQSRTRSAPFPQASRKRLAPPERAACPQPTRRTSRRRLQKGLRMPNRRQRLTAPRQLWPRRPPTWLQYPARLRPQAGRCP